ncbi:tetratricopeptide repeat protein [Streptomyces sp. S.PB5]|uniref:tetratricopeptide repeat protein n=1 Tax=Streptomyces sp. S.PB5 TaxID=3020844 RepID=UPI0025B22904|nr:tetratricopeptide repeat protein [Streptomyces sp. S.PB5]MDN3024745.1 tetratricopeptide repeat protein [Streptomyces sp. S.PB5]
MSRLSREKREQKDAGAPVLAAAPIDVLVGEGGASVGGVPVSAVPGEEIQHTVLNHLQRIAVATGHPVHATVHDDRIGYVVALRIESNGASQFTAEPVPTAPPGERGEAQHPTSPVALPAASAAGPELPSGPVALAHGVHGVHGAHRASAHGASGALGAAGDAAASAPGAAQRHAPAAPAPSTPAPSTPGAAESVEGFPPHPAVGGPVPPESSARPGAPGADGAFAPQSAEGTPAPPQSSVTPRTTWPAPPSDPSGTPGAAESTWDDVPPAQLEETPEPADQPHPDQPHRDKPTHLLRQTPEPPTFPIRAVPDPAGQEPRDAVPTFRLRAVPEWVADAVPGTVAPPTGQFGPPPVMDAPATDVHPADASANAPAPETGEQPVTAPASTQTPAPVPPPASLSVAAPAPKPAVDYSSARLDDPDPKPTPPRGFDAVAEAVLGDDPATAYDGGGSVFLAGPMARINEAVKSGRIAEAARLAEETVVEASRALGGEHPEVLRLLELTAYIAYLADDPVRAFGLSLDLARIRHRARDAEAAYGNVQSAATAWRAVRDPEQGLRMGVELIGLWTELTMEDGPAVEDAEQLESARTRMGRLAERARKLNS